MRPPMTAGPISRNSRFLNLSMGFCWPPGAAGTLPSNALRKATAIRVVRRALNIDFISIPPLCAESGILPLPAGVVHHMYLEGPTNPVQKQTHHAPAAFHARAIPAGPFFAAACNFLGVLAF